MPPEPPAAATYLRLADEVRGPFTPAQLRHLAEALVITPETPAASAAAGPWAPLRDQPGAEGIFPARREFQFKAAAFERVNATAAPPVDHRDLIAAANREPPAETPPPPPPNDVLDLVRDTARFQAPFERPLDLTRHPGRRWRDYLVSMAAVNGFFLAAIILSRGNLAVVLYGLSGMAVASAGLTWIMFGILRRY